VICDRFYDSTYAYQGYARGLPVDTVREINAFATSGLVPDSTLLYDLPVETAQARGGKMELKGDRLENERGEFHEKVRAGYLELARSEPGRIRIIDGSLSIEAVWGKTWELTRDFLKTRGFEIIDE
jgi:dTMP kinase